MDNIEQIKTLADAIGQVGLLVVVTSISYNLYRMERVKVDESHKAHIQDLQEQQERRIEDYKRWTDTLTSILMQRNTIGGSGI